MKRCAYCDELLDTVAKAAGSDFCSACSWEAGSMRDGDDPKTSVETSVMEEHAA